MLNAKNYYDKMKKGEIIDNNDNPFSKKNNNEDDIHKKDQRKSFRDLIKRKYKIKDNRLYYIYTRCKNKVIEKKIPYKVELPYIFYSCHVQKQIHLSLNKTKENLKNSDYYYEGIVSDLLTYVNKCPKCSVLKNIRPVGIPMKLIIEDGPHYRYEMDIWYLEDDIAKSTGFNYILDIIDVFSKWVFSYPLKHKNCQEILLALRKYIISFGMCRKLQTDNGREFRNAIINNFCIENNIERLFSPPYLPRANGAVESVHKIIKKYVNDYYYTSDEDDYNIDLPLLDAIEFHNYNVHSSTKYKQIDLKDITDIEIIEKVKNNIKNTVGKKIFKNNSLLLEKGDKLLINNNITITKTSIILKNKNKKGIYNIPAVFLEYNKYNLLKVEFKKNYLNIIKENDIFNVNNNLVRLVNNDAFNYFLDNN